PGAAGGGHAGPEPPGAAFDSSAAPRFSSDAGPHVPAGTGRPRCGRLRPLAAVDRPAAEDTDETADPLDAGHRITGPVDRDANGPEGHIAEVIRAAQHDRGVHAGRPRPRCRTG